MSGYVITEAAEAQAIGLCWLARQPGLPDIHALREASAQLHPGECGWCAYPLPELLRMLADSGVTDFQDRQWWKLPGQARLRAIALAQGAS